MGKNKDRQSHSAAKQIMVKGTTSGSGKSQTSATSGLAGCLDVVQANQNAYTASQDNLVGKVLVKRQGQVLQKLMMSHTKCLIICQNAVLNLNLPQKFLAP